MTVEALVIFHNAEDCLGGFARPLAEGGYRVRFAHASQFTRDDAITADLVVLAGGTMSALEQDRFPWLRDELALIALRIARDLPTLGICLGAQLIALAGGGGVFRGEVPEIGFGEVALTAHGRTSPLFAIEGVPLLHWHSDGILIPSCARLLARTAGYAQGFELGNRVLALQFHAEMGEDPRFENWLTEHAANVEAAGLSPDRLRQDHAEWGAPAVRAGRAMLGAWLSGLEPLSRAA